MRSEERSNVKDPKYEYRLCFLVTPCFLFLWLLVYATGAGKSFQAIVFGMPIHELGHAVADWFAGYNAVPTVWKTLTPESRGFIATLVVFTSIAYWGYLSVKDNKLGFLLVAMAWVWY
jgi:hypothetical protein